MKESKKEKESIGKKIKEFRTKKEREREKKKRGGGQVLRDKEGFNTGSNASVADRGGSVIVLIYTAASVRASLHTRVRHTRGL